MFGLITKPISCLFWFLLGSLFLIVALACALFFGAEFVAPKIGEKYIEIKTGFQASIESTDMGVFSNQLSIKALNLKNPKKISPEAFAHLNTFAIDADPLSLFKDEVIIDELVIDIENITYIEGKDGTSNVRQFVEAFAQTTESTQPEPNEQASTRTVYIKKLTVRLKTVHAIDRSAAKTQKREFEINYERHFNEVNNITTDFIIPLANDLTSYRLKFLVSAILKPWGQVSQFDLIKNQLNTIWNQSEGNGSNTTEQIKKLFEILE